MDKDCGHSFVAGVMYVSAQDLDTVSQERVIECEYCEYAIGPDTPRDVVDTLMDTCL